ncbi:MAG: hydrogenase maturation protease [Lentisphaeria bacterium]
MSKTDNQHKPVIVLGLGNTLMRDEAVGVKLVQTLDEQNDRQFADVEFADYGTAGMRVLHAIANRRKAIIVDCALMDLPPGSIKRFTPDNVRSIKRMPGFSLHEGDLLSILNLSSQLGEIPDETVIYGIEPEIVAPGEELSETLATSFESYIAKIHEEIATRPF